MKILLGYVLTFGWVFLMLAAVQLIKKRFKLGDEASRKIVHVSVAFSWIPMYLCFGATWHLLVPPVLVTVMNYISCRTGILSMMERSDSEKRSYGTVFYSLSMLIMSAFCLWNEKCLVPYGMGLFCMGLGDGFAPYFGTIKRGNRSFFGGKRTLYGCMGVFLICGAVLCAMNAVFALEMRWWQLLIVAWGATIFEIVGVKGTDNLTLPLGVFILTCLFVL